MNAPARTIMFGAGDGFVVHKTGARFTREDCLGVRKYLEAQIADPSRGQDSREYLTRWRAELDAAMAASWPPEPTRLT